MQKRNQIAKSLYRAHVADVLLANGTAVKAVVQAGRVAYIDRPLSSVELAGLYSLEESRRQLAEFGWQAVTLWGRNEYCGGRQGLTTDQDA